MKPVIGVMPLLDSKRESYWMLPGYMQGVERAGGIPVMLPLTEDEEDIDFIAEKFDGFLLTGGQDVSPELYGEERLDLCGECSSLRDGMEKRLFTDAVEEDKPVLGICRGIQFINAVLGGTLYQDLTAQKPSDTEHCQKPPYDRPVHRVDIKCGTPLYELIGKQSLYVNSYHHQAVKELAPRLRAMAYSSDGLTEAVYMPDKSFVWAVQWHPEFSYKTDEDSRKIFSALVKAACRYRKIT